MPRTPLNIYFTYATSLYNNKEYKKIVYWYVARVREILTEDQEDPTIVGIIGSGSSGALIAAAILNSRQTRSLSYVHVQKTEGHNGVWSGKNISGTYIFVDDFIQTGGTF